VSGVRISALALFFFLHAPSRILHHMRQQPLFESVEEFWRRFCTAPCSVCVAVSGGSDSVTLFHVLLALRRRLGITRLGIAHVNHRLRGRDSERDAAFVRRIAAGAGAAFHLKEIDRKEVPRSGVEEWARDERYVFFSSVIKAGRYRYLATAHTMNDQAETVVLRLLRGSGIHGLCGILPIRDKRIIRPFLHVSKSDLRKWLKEKKLAFREDSTNADISYTRNWVRHNFIPLLEKKEPGALTYLGSIADNARTISEIIHPIINKWVNKNVVSIDTTRFLVKKTGFSDEVTAAEALVSVLREKKIGFDSCHVDSLLINQTRKSGTFLLPGGWRYVCKKDAVEFFNKETAGKRGDFYYDLISNGATKCPEKNCTLIIKRYKSRPARTLSFSDSMTAWLDAGAIAGQLVFRSWKHGERFWPYGARGYEDLNVFLKKQGIRQEDRLATGVVAEKHGEIVWIPGLRVSHRKRITAATGAVIKISCKPIG
jgi:tRNA(Ile)-lysidine synthase